MHRSRHRTRPDDRRASVNGAAASAPAGSSLGDLVAALGFAGRPRRRRGRTSEVVPRARLADRMLVGGERIEIVTFVGGG